MRLEVRDGYVNYYVVSGSQTVSGKMTETAAKTLCKDAIRSNAKKGYEIKAGEYIFEGRFFDEEKPKRKKR